MEPGDYIESFLHPATNHGIRSSMQSVQDPGALFDRLRTDRVQRKHLQQDESVKSQSGSVQTTRIALNVTFPCAALVGKWNDHETATRVGVFHGILDLIAQLRPSKTVRPSITSADQPVRVVPIRFTTKSNRDFQRQSMKSCSLQPPHWSSLTFDFQSTIDSYPGRDGSSDDDVNDDRLRVRNDDQDVLCPGLHTVSVAFCAVLVSVSESDLTVRQQTGLSLSCFACGPVVIRFFFRKFVYVIVQWIYESNRQKDLAISIFRTRNFVKIFPSNSLQLSSNILYLLASVSVLLNQMMPLVAISLGGIRIE